MRLLDFIGLAVFFYIFIFGFWDKGLAFWKAVICEKGKHSELRRPSPLLALFPSWPRRCSALWWSECSDRVQDSGVSRRRGCADFTNSSAFFRFFLLVIVGSLVSIASFLPMSLLYTGAAPVAKFLFIAGRTDTPLTGIPVISRRAGKRKSILRSFRTHKDHAPFFYIIDPSKKRFNINNQKIQRNT